MGPNKVYDPQSEVFELKFTSDTIKLPTTWMSHFNENEDTTKNDSGETKTQYKKFTWKKKTNQKKATSKLAKCSWAIKWTHHHYLMLSSIFFYCYAKMFVIITKKTFLFRQLQWKRKNLTNICTKAWHAVRGANI